MTTTFKDGIISKDGVNQGVKVPPTGTNAPGQNVAGGNIQSLLQISLKVLKTSAKKYMMVFQEAQKIL